MAITNKVLDSAGVSKLWSKIKAELAERDETIKNIQENAYDDTALKNEINGAISAETTERTNADNEIKGRLDTLEAFDHEAAKQAAIDAAKEYTDGVKDAILGDGIKDTFDTLVEIQNWIEGDGVDATELTSAIAAEATDRTNEDNLIKGRLDVLEGLEALSDDDIEAICTATVTE